MTRSVFPWNSVISYPEAVPSINYIGRQLDVSYIGRQVYGEIIDLSKAVPSINTLVDNLTSPILVVKCTEKYLSIR